MEVNLNEVDLHIFVKIINTMRHTLSLIFCFFLFVVSAQDCAVSIDDLTAETYVGDCKKGLANGEGEARFADFTFKGSFKKGVPQGEGTITFDSGQTLIVETKKGKIFGFGKLYKGEELLEEGYWKGTLDKYRFMGTEESDLLGYKILQKDNIDKSQFKLTKSENNSKQLTIRLADPSNRSISSINVQERNNGQVSQFTETTSRSFVEISAIEFPYVMNLTYNVAANQGANSSVFVILRFEITEPGDWLLSISH